MLPLFYHIIIFIHCFIACECYRNKLFLYFTLGILIYLSILFPSNKVDGVNVLMEGNKAKQVDHDPVMGPVARVRICVIMINLGQLPISIFNERYNSALCVDYFRGLIAQCCIILPCLL